MGLFFKKSKKLGLFRLNFSKSGIGVSFGVKGCRISTNSKRTQVNIGANGVYYRKSISNKKLKNAVEQNNSNQEYIADNIPQAIATIYETPELTKFRNIFILQCFGTILIFITLWFIKLKFLSFIAFLAGLIVIFKYIKKHPNEYKAFIEEGEKINELKRQNYQVEIKQGNPDTQSEEAIERRNKSKYQNYRYSHETYNKDKK